MPSLEDISLPKSEFVKFFKGSKFVAGLLSIFGVFIPFLGGVAQIYKGQIARGVAFCIIQTLNFLLVFVIVGAVTYPLVSFYIIYDSLTYWPEEHTR